MFRRFAPAMLAAAMITGIAHADHHEERLNANTATAEQLAAIGVGGATSDAILGGQPFASTAAYDAVIDPNMPDADKADLYARVFVPIDLNKATRDEIMLIPGMSRRMAHEFEEYRPYSSLDQFNREIGKYVDEAEVARLRSYVTLNQE